MTNETPRTCRFITQAHWGRGVRSKRHYGCEDELPRRILRACLLRLPEHQCETLVAFSSLSITSILLGLAPGSIVTPSSTHVHTVSLSFFVPPSFHSLFSSPVCVCVCVCLTRDPICSPPPPSYTRAHIPTLSSPSQCSTDSPSVPVLLSGST